MPDDADVRGNKAASTRLEMRKDVRVATRTGTYSGAGLPVSDRTPVSSLESEIRTVVK